MRREHKATKTVAQVVIERVGFTKAYRVQLHTACWWITTAALGRPPQTVEEYAEWWSMMPRKGYRDQALFRQAWPEFATPIELAEALGYDFSGLLKEDQKRVTVDLLGWAAPA